MSSSPTLMTLPLELQRDILDLLPFPTLQVIHATHPYFRATIDLKDKRASLHPPKLLDQMVTASQSDPFRQANDHSPCSDCFRLRPGSKFPDKMKRKHRFRRRRWFCIDCGIDHRYTPGVILRFSNIPAVWCKRCMLFKVGYDTVVPLPGVWKPNHPPWGYKRCMILKLWYDTVVPTGGMCKPCHQQHEVVKEEKMQAWHHQDIGKDVQTDGQ